MKNIKSKKFLSLLGIAVLIVLFQLNFSRTEEAKSEEPFSLPKLPYKYNALEPYIDSKTMEIHHQKHHAAYVQNLNEAINKYPEFKGKTIEYLLNNLEDLPDDIREAVRNNGGGHYNHSLFWNMMGSSKKDYEPSGLLKEDIVKTFGSLDDFKLEFKNAAAKRFGSGWVWLIKEKGEDLRIVSTPYQDSPIMEGISPILALDVWEHAYYLKYHNKRGDYVDNWWNVVNWSEIEKRYLDSIK